MARPDSSEQDHVDLERLIAVQGEDFDLTYARNQLVAHMGEDDHRVAALDEYARRWLGTENHGVSG